MRTDHDKNSRLCFLPLSYLHRSDLFLSQELLKTCLPRTHRSILITDAHLAENLGNQLQQILGVDKIVMPAGESFKTRETKQQLEDELLAKSYGRDTCLIALGGGVVCDMVGFLASTYCRGVPSVYIPTTLLAMADASVGGKTGVNTPLGKNMIGTFYDPKAVFMDVQTLNSLPEREWKNGFVEIFKHALIYDKNLFLKIRKNKKKILNRDLDFMTELILASCEIKKKVVEIDEKEQYLRRILNFGHTIGHAIESFEKYEICHGQAVAVGILVESYMSFQCGYLNQSAFEEIEQLLKEFAVCAPTKIFEDKTTFFSLIKRDKKSVQKKTHFILLADIGQVYCEKNSYSVEVSEEICNKTLEWAKEKMAYEFLSSN